MKKLILIAALVALAGCNSTMYTEATRADGSKVKHIAIAPGTKVTGPNGGCIDTTGAVTACPMTTE
ncbi:MAG: hypothetical protein E7A34_00145 [Leclercia adecarboxylata]|nr:hypothetical protein [Leclercia adecarboxylata]MDU1082784.1 hypothetical protein [Leclercia adecarboxylata]